MKHLFTYLQLDNSIHQAVRHAKDTLMEPIARICMALRITPNMVSVLSFVISLVGVWFLFQDAFVWFVVATGIAVLGDGLDGTLARLSKTSSVKGERLDHTLDLLSMIALFVALTFYVEQLLWLISLGLYLLVYGGYWLRRQHTRVSSMRNLLFIVSLFATQFALFGIGFYALLLCVVPLFTFRSK